MARGSKFVTVAAQKRRLQEGRGQGDGKDYRCWLRVPDGGPKGRRHRVFVPKFGRVLHYLSDLEADGGGVAEFRPDVISNREQFPLLPLSETQEIAEQLGVRHPRPPSGSHDIIMTTDQVWTVQLPQGRWLMPFSMKYECDLKNDRVLEKHAIETEYWKRRPSCFPLQFFTETSVSSIFICNWNLIRGKLRPNYFKHFPPRIVERVDTLLRSAALSGSAPLVELTGMGARDLGLAQSQVLSAIHYLIATDIWAIDLDAVQLAPSARLFARQSRAA